MTKLPEIQREFVSFHTHNTYSYGDALGTPKVHAQRAVDLGMWALGSSNHGNLNDNAAHERECKAVGIKPIFGCEIYYGPVGEDQTRRKTHLTIFAMDEEGYLNLNKIVTQSYRDAYQFPTVSWENLCEHSAGIAVLSGCADSLISCTLLGGKYLGEQRSMVTQDSYDNARREVLRFADVFEGRYFLEVQRFPHFDRTCALNPTYAQLSTDTGIPLIATADVHYPFPEQNKIQATLHAARWKSTPEFAAEASWEHSANLTYPLTDDEIRDDLVATGLTEDQARQAISQTSELAHRCTVELPRAKPLKFAVPVAGLTSRDYFKSQIVAGLNRRMKQRPDIRENLAEYRQRINHEFKIIDDKDFSDYFLVIQDLVKRAKDRSTDIGPARGSAAASLICYLLGITEIDPLHPLFRRMIFERFIDPNRTDWPDIDLDFDDAKRRDTERDAREIYGDANVASVANHTGYHAKNSLKDVARAFQLPPETFRAIAKRADVRNEADERRDDTIRDVVDSYASLPEVAKLVEAHWDKIQIAMEFEKNEREMGVHACGYIISSEPITDVCAIYQKSSGQGSARKTAYVIPYEKRDAEKLGLLKADFLGSTTMGAIGLMRNWSKMSLEDLCLLIYREYPKWIAARKRKAFRGNVFDTVLKGFQNDDVTGIMQFEGGTTRNVCRAVQPDDFDTLAACTALSRPGPYYGGQFKEYVAVRNGERDWQRIHPTGFDRHVEWTYGQIVYQEQIMWILRDMAGFDTDEVIRIRKIIGKKLGEFQFEEIKNAFVEGCARTCGVSEEDALRVFAGIRTSASYAFNTAHAYAYALIAWWQMWFKQKHPLEFFAATLAKNGEEKKRIPRRTAVLQDTEAHDIGVGGWFPSGATDVNWTPVWRVDQLKKYNGFVMPGFIQIPKVGESIAHSIVKWRNNLEFSQYPNDPGLPSEEIENAWWRLMGSDNKKGGCSGIGPGTAERIIEFVNRRDPLGVNKTADQLTAFRKQLVNGEFVNTGLPADPDLYAMSDSLPAVAHCAFVGFVANIVYRDEIESIRGRTGLDIATIRAQLEDPEKTKKATVFAYDEHGEVALRVSRWQYDRLAAKLSKIEADHHIIVGFGRTYEANANSIQLKSIWVLNPD